MRAIAYHFSGSCSRVQARSHRCSDVARDLAPSGAGWSCL